MYLMSQTISIVSLSSWVHCKTLSPMKGSLGASGRATGRCISPWRSSTTHRAGMAGTGNQAQESQRQ